MTALNKQALRERYSPQPEPKCHICGAEMTVQRISASRITYVCTGATYDDAGYHYAEGRSIADYHYEQSRVIVVDVSDPEVLAMPDELEKTQKGEKQWREVVDAFCVDDADWHKLTTSNNELISFLSQALCKQVDRIAELEAREVVVKQFDDFQIVHYGGSEDYAKGYIDCQNNYNKALTAAGIGVKGE
ncbi:ead/Ea22-like family protein [Citrobacter freundii]